MYLCGMKLLWVILTFVLALFSLNIYAQQNPNEYQEEKPVLLRNEASFGILVHSNGFGIEAKRSFQQTNKKKIIYEAQLVGMKHPKEYKQVNNRFENPKSFVYGKMNTFTILRMAAGQQQILFGKAERTGVEVRFNYLGGLSLGMTKPVYLLIDRSTGFGDIGSLVEEKYNPDNEYQNNIDNIAGRASFTKGLDELRPYPGIFAKAGLNFEYAPFHEDIKSLEVGAALDVYGKKIPIMAFTQNKQIFLSFYITLIYGHKW